MLVKQRPLFFISMMLGAYLNLRYYFKMIPEFPKFKKIELGDKENIEKITRYYPPYSDFNFDSLWTWDINNKVKISILNGNLVVRFNDYLTREPFFSFIGDKKVVATIEVLLAHSKANGMLEKLRLLPEVNFSREIKNLNKYMFIEDRDSFDYIYSNQNLATFPGFEFSQCRKMCNRFITRNKNIEVRDLDLASIDNRMQVLDLNHRWKANKEVDYDSENEKEALNRLLSSADNLSLINVGVFINNELVAFTINEKTSKRFALSHFAKFDIKYVGVYTYSMKVTGERLLKESYEYMNCEQDLGLQGLRKAKQALRPVFFLRKYTLTPIR